ncbi:MAG: MXAN_5187 C-terminal domain-containing protein [Myxococcota bacterium]|jgi:hypothetical protein|nr:MXAN_5187 C-terminal domain-containing protein [Myxococcota bacterium]
MRKQRKIAWLLCTLFFAAVVVLILQRTSSITQSYPTLKKALLEANTESLRNKLLEEDRKLIDQIQAISENQNLIQDVGRVVISQKRYDSASARKKLKLDKRLKNQRTLLEERLIRIKQNHPNIDKVTIVNPQGVILYSETQSLPAGSGTINLSKLNQAENDENKKPWAFVGKALEGSSQIRTQTWLGQVYRHAALSLVLKKKTIAALILHEKLDILPELKNSQAFVVVDQYVIGKIPPAVKLSDLKTTPLALHLPSQIEPPSFPLISFIKLTSFFINTHEMGLSIIEAPLPERPYMRAFIYNDSGDILKDIAAYQWAIILLGLMLWIVASSLILNTGTKLLWGVEHISDFLGRVHQGMPDDKHLAVHELDPELNRLGRLANKLVERMPKPGSVTAIKKLEDIIKTNPNQRPAELSEQEFSGLETPPMNKTVVAGLPAFKKEKSSEDDQKELPRLTDVLEKHVEVVEEENNDTAKDNLPLEHQGQALGTQQMAAFDPESSGSSGKTSDDGNFNKLYHEFITMRRACGESIEQLTYDKFAKRIMKTKNSVMEKHQCEDVFFKVYSKNGKAALKAIPKRPTQPV